MSPPTVRLPAGPVTPHGAYHILHDRIPQMGIRAYDNSCVFHLMGGLAIPDRTRPERVEITTLDGLIPPWQTIDQKGATEDGATFIDALYDPMEINLGVVCHGRDPSWCRKVTNWLIGSIDAKQQSELFWFTHEMGRWWAPIRWFKTPAKGWRQSKRLPMDLRLRVDSAFWQSYPDVDEFGYAFTNVDEDFGTDDPDDMGPNYDIDYTGTGGGFMYVDDGALRWKDDPDDPILTNGRTGVFRRKSFTTPTDNQVVSTTLGSFPEWSFPDNAETILGARLKTTGDPSDNGVFADFGIGYCRLSYKINGTQTVLKEQPMLIPPLPGETFTLICGYADNPRKYVLRRNFALGIGVNIMTVIESAAASQMGPTFRAAGGGMHAGAAILSQATPATMRDFRAGDNNGTGDINTTQTGFVRCINAGDQEMWKTYTCYGPFDKVRIADGPGSANFVEFGPLLSGQAVQIRSDPRKYGVKLLTQQTPITSQEQQNLIEEVLSFITFNSVTHILDVFQSLFGIFSGGSAADTAPQGNVYRFLKGRFSNAIPAKSPGNPAQVYHVAVEITGGNADSRIIAAGTPLRRYPY